MSATPTPESLYLHTLARHISAPYVALPGARAAMLSGSAAEGISDRYSDIDMMLYYDELPPAEALQLARQHNRGSALLWTIGERETGSFIEAYAVNGVECQIVHTTLAVWEQSIASVLRDLDVETPLQKALEGILHGIPLYGSALIEQWQASVAAYPDALAQKMVEHYLRFTPIWFIQERLLGRDATLWRYQIFVESAHHLLAVLAGLNRVYFSSFQFKRTHAFAERLTLKPANFASRLEACFTQEPRPAICELTHLIADTVTLVEQHMPAADTSRIRARLTQQQAPWTLPPTAEQGDNLSD
ncbi:MAG: hypothetical protein NT075_26740 [Chloroflexi bacterium]|nr:hypothetical protein [Chloroflexota bacterium]